MRSKLLFLLVFSIAAGVIVGCSKEAAGKLMARELVGTWKWIRTDGGFAFNIHETPASTGKNVDLKIDADGKYAVYTNGVLTTEGTCTMETRKCIHDHADKPFISFSGGRGWMIEQLGNGKLELSDETYDGVGSSYERKP